MIFHEVFICENPDPDLPMSEQSLSREDKPGDVAELFRGEPGMTAEAMLFSLPIQTYNWVPSPSPMVRREYFDRGLRYIGPPRLTVQFEDYLMWLILAFHCDFFAIGEPLAIYRIHSEQFVSRFRNEGKRLGRLRGLEQVFRCLIEECGEEIRLLGMQKRIWQQFEKTALWSVERSDWREFPGLFVISLRRSFALKFLRAWAVRTLHQLNYASRRMVQPFLKRML
jgi:hypothetical protein